MRCGVRTEQTILIQPVSGFPETRRPLAQEERALHPIVCRWSQADPGYLYGIHSPHRALLEAALDDLHPIEPGWIIYDSRTGPVLIKRKDGPRGTFYGEPSTIAPDRMRNLLIDLLE